MNPNRTLPGLAARLVQVAFSFESVFVLFLFAGIYKADTRLQWIPVDITALFAGLSLSVGCWVVAKRSFVLSKVGIGLILLCGLFASYIVLSLVWSPSRDYGTTKALYASTLLMWSLAGAALVVAPDSERIGRFISLLRILALWIALETVFAFIQSPEGATLSALGGNYLGIGRVAGIGAILFLAVGGDPSRGRAARFLSLALVAALFGVLLVVGGRGPLLATLCAGLLPILAGVRPTRYHVLAIRRHAASLLAIGGCAVALIGYLVWSGNRSFATIRRIGLLFSASGGQSASERIYYYRTAIAQWFESPLLGNGAGSWPVLALNQDARGYPHNIVLETLAEFGLVGLFLLLLLCAYGLSPLMTERRLWRSPTAILLCMLLANAAFNAMVTGDITDNRFLFTSLGLLAVGLKSGYAHAD